MNRVLRLLLIGLVLATCFLATPVFAASDDSASSSFFPSLQYDPNSILNKYPYSNYLFDGTGILMRSNPMYDIDNFLLFFGTLFARTGAMILDFGFHLQTYEVLLNAVVQIASRTQDVIMTPYFPLFCLIWIFYLIFDTIRSNFARAWSRSLKVISIIVAIVLYSNIGSSLISNVVETTSGVTDLFAGTLITVTHINEDDASLSATTGTMLDQTWRNTLLSPYLQGEMGGDLLIQPEDLPEVKSLVPHPEYLSESSPHWYEALLQLPVENNKRDQLVDMLNSDKYPKAQLAFDNWSRFGYSLMMFISIIAAAALFVMLGGLSLLFNILFYLSLLVGILVLPMELVPNTTVRPLLAWWFKLVLGTILAQIGLGIYLAVVEIAVSLLQMLTADWDIAYILSLLLQAALYILAIVSFRWLVQKLKVVERYNNAVDKQIGKVKFGSKQDPIQMKTKALSVPTSTDVRKFATQLRSASKNFSRDVVNQSLLLRPFRAKLNPPTADPIDSETEENATDASPAVEPAAQAQPEPPSRSRPPSSSTSLRGFQQAMKRPSFRSPASAAQPPTKGTRSPSPQARPLQTPSQPTPEETAAPPTNSRFGRYRIVKHEGRAGKKVASVLNRGFGAHSRFKLKSRSATESTGLKRPVTVQRSFGLKGNLWRRTTQAEQRARSEVAVSGIETPTKPRPLFLNRTFGTQKQRISLRASISSNRDASTDQTPTVGLHQPPVIQRRTTPTFSKLTPSTSTLTRTPTKPKHIKRILPHTKTPRIRKKMLPKPKFPPVIRRKR